MDHTVLFALPLTIAERQLAIRAVCIGRPRTPCYCENDEVSVVRNISGFSRAWSTPNVGMTGMAAACPSPLPLAVRKSRAARRDHHHRARGVGVTCNWLDHLLFINHYTRAKWGLPLTQGIASGASAPSQ